MTPSREKIYAALFDKISTLSPAGSALFTTVDRRLRHWSDVQIEEHPALFQSQMNEVLTQTRGIPAKHVLNVSLYVYVHTEAQQDKDVVPSSLLNPLIDAIEESLAPDNSDGTCTLGGLVSHCWIEGTIETSEGALGNQEVAIVPIHILTP
jgi:hypothetical protein